MRTILNIIIIAFIIYTAFYFRSDMKDIYNNIFSAVNKNNIVDSNSLSKFEIDPKSQSKLDVLKKIINTPEPLRILDPIITGDINNKTLTRAGVIYETNKNRKDVSNLPPLVENPKLDLSAQNKVKEMFTNQYFEHVSPVTKKGVADLGNDVGYEYVLIGENLAMGSFKDDAALLQAWMDSPGHRANILNTHYTEMGAAIGQGVFEGREVWLAVQHFGTPKDECPVIEKTLETSIGINKTKLDDIQKTLTQEKKNIDNGGVVAGKTTNEQVLQYNNLVVEYNSLLAKLRNQITKFNGEVNSFNTCINSLK